MNAATRVILEAVRDGRVTPGTRAMAASLLKAEERLDALKAAKACTSAKVAKAAIESIGHHEKYRRAQERELEAVKREVWDEVLDRTWRDHRGFRCCESCHKNPVALLDLEPHHLALGSREDRVDWVMALCATCHRTGTKSAHSAPLWFAQKVVIPWAQAHGYQLPNRKEFRT